MESVVNSVGEDTLLGGSEIAGVLESVVDTIGESEIVGPGSVVNFTGLVTLVDSETIESVVDPVGKSEILESVVDSVGVEAFPGGSDAMGVVEYVVDTVGE